MPNWGSLTYESEKFGELVRALDDVVGTTDSILLLGEPGCGKTAIAKAVHVRGTRSTRPFVAVECTSVAETLFESELFGHEKGAFTGAGAQKKGRFEEANGGTLFLDEVGELPLALQGKLLRAVDEKVIRRVGASRDTTVDVRLIAATNRDLAKAAADGSFREDLLARLSTFPFVVPPLRSRPEDIVPIANAIYVADHDVGRGTFQLPPELPGDVLEVLKAYGWPGNVRELQKVVRRLIVHCGRSGAIEPADAQMQIARSIVPAPPSAAAPPAGTERIDLAAELEQEKRRRVVAALRAAGGNIARAAYLLTTTKQTLHKYLQTRGGLKAFGFGDSQ